MENITYGVIRIVIFLFLCIITVPCIAIEPTWTYTDSQVQIADLIVSPDGSAVVAGAGKVVLLSQNGTVLAKEPYGEILAQSRDGSTIVSGYSSVVSSTIYLFKVTKDAAGNPSLQKQWDAILPNRVDSFAVSDKGDRIAFSAGGMGVYVYDGKTGKSLGHSDEYSSIIAISGGRGNTIAGVSTVQGLKIYNPSGTLKKKYDSILAGEPRSLLLDTNGTFIVFNAGPYIIAFNTSKGAEEWKMRSVSDVTMLAMTPSGGHIVAVTTNGTIDLYDMKGNLNWTYFSNSGTGAGQAINAIAVTPNGSKIFAGSADGKLLFLDSAGALLWSYKTGKAPIQKVAIASDGSFAAAASDTFIYAFFTGEMVSDAMYTVNGIPVQTITPGASLTKVSDTPSTWSNAQSTQHPVISEIPTVTLTEYSVIRKTTQSPLDGIAIIVGLLGLLLVLRL
jgi:WD40 repeat protein